MQRYLISEVTKCNHSISISTFGQHFKTGEPLQSLSLKSDKQTRKNHLKVKKKKTQIKSVVLSHFIDRIAVLMTFTISSLLQEYRKSKIPVTQLNRCTYLTSLHCSKCIFIVKKVGSATIQNAVLLILEQFQRSRCYY